MQKIVSVGLLAFCWIAISQQQASAWVNSRFFVGVGWHCQSGGNSFLWGLCHNGQVPGPEAFTGQHAPPRHHFLHGLFHHTPYPNMHNLAPLAYVPQDSFQYTYSDPSNVYYPSSSFQFANQPGQAPYYYSPATWYGNR